MDKSPDAFRTISEVAEDLDLPQHVPCVSGKPDSTRSSR